MATHIPSLAMSQVLPTDLSPSWDYSPTADSFAYAYYSLPSPPHSVGSTSSDSPPPTNRMLKMRMNSESPVDGMCLPTHQVFDFPEVSHLPSPPIHDSLPQPPSISINTSAKRSASPPPTVAKKRAVGERISSKDFVPPDVTGLSKREARLVKNRAAAFLSRQRKREEFEAMEHRVAELEQENARLLSLTKNGNTPSQPHPDLLSEVDQLRAKLAAAEERERELTAELARKSAAAPSVKVEALEPQFPLSTPPRSTNLQSQHKSNASLGLMVLLCALPSLLSMPAQSSLPATFSLPTALSTSSSSFDFNSYLPNEYDWSQNHATTEGDQPKLSPSRRLEFADVDSDLLKALGCLDISFDTIPSDDGKIRVRIHPTSSVTGVPALASSNSPMKPSLDIWTGPDSHSGFESALASMSFTNSDIHYSLTGQDDPFLGIGGISNDYGLSYTSSSSMPFGQEGVHAGSQMTGVAFASECAVNDATTGKRRVRIALKSLPTAGGEGGEWEVQFC